MVHRAYLCGCKLLSISALALAASTAQASVLYNETTSGDLSDNQAAPNAFTLSNGTNSIIGTVGGTNTQDWVALTVPSGFQLSSLVLSGYSSTDGQGFTGLQSGSSFVGSPFTAASYLGYTHFGTAATNGSLPVANLLNTDILPLMGEAGPTGPAAGAIGFTPPLSAGTYTFLIQQLGASTNYQFDYNVTAVPEPGTLALCSLGATGLAVLRKRRPSKSAV